VPRGELGCTGGEEARLERLGAEGEGGEEMTDEVDRVLDLVRVVVVGVRMQRATICHAKARSAMISIRGARRNAPRHELGRQSSDASWRRAKAGAMPVDGE